MEKLLDMYWLFTISISVLSIFITVIILKWNAVKSILKRKIRLFNVDERIRSNVYEVLKELSVLHRKYIRKQVRDYLKEISSYDPPTQTQKRRFTKKKNISNDKVK